MKRATLLSFALGFTGLMCWSRGASASPSTINAAHQVTVEDGQLRVTSRWYGHLPRDGWAFAAPLPPGTRALDQGATLTLDPVDQHVVGIRFDDPPYPLVIEVAIPWAEGDSVLALPLPPEPGWQRVEIESDHRLIPDASVALPLHTTGYYGPGDLRVRDRLRIDRQLDGRHPAGAAYLPGALVREAGGVPARLESGAERRLGLGLAAGGAFVIGLLALAVVFRRSTVEVEVEDAEAYLESEFHELDNSASRETA